MTTIPSEIVSKFYEMDPQTDDLLPNGWRLKNGMVVLSEARLLREDVDKLSEDSSLYWWDKAKERNRWATVSDLSYQGDIVSFVATYADGTKRQRMYSCGYAWLVKLDSIPKDEQYPSACGHAINLYHPHCAFVGCSNNVRCAGLFTQS